MKKLVMMSMACFLSIATLTACNEKDEEADTSAPATMEKKQPVAPASASMKEEDNN